MAIAGGRQFSAYIYIYTCARGLYLVILRIKHLQSTLILMLWICPLLSPTRARLPEVAKKEPGKECQYNHCAPLSVTGFLALCMFSFASGIVVVIL